MNTVDDRSYYRRTGSSKAAFVDAFVAKHDDIKLIYDVGCNNGNMSYPLQHKYNKAVVGVDLSGKLGLPSDYNFKRMDIVEDNSVFMNDCTLFLSLYHHVLGWNGLEVADDLFYKLLLRTNYLVFDTGNVSEKKRRKYQWHPAQQKIFSTEKELLDHFGLPYEEIGEWKIGGGSRKIVVFRRDDFDLSVSVEGPLYRLYGTPRQHIGLVDDKFTKHVWDHTLFHKLTIGDKVMFAKNHLDGVYTYKNGKELILNGKSRNNKELSNTISVYDARDKHELIKFYGFSDKYGLLYEWLEEFTYVGKESVFQAGSRRLNDVDSILVDGQKKYIDFLS